MATKSIPNLVKHTALAIYNSGDISGGKKEKFQSAWNIARSRLVEYGYLSKGSEDGPVEKIQLTSKGHQREAIHASEPGSKTKSMLFDQMYKWIETPDETSTTTAATKEATSKEITGSMVKTVKKKVASKKKIK